MRRGPRPPHVWELNIDGSGTGTCVHCGINSRKRKGSVCPVRLQKRLADDPRESLLAEIEKRLEGKEFKDTWGLPAISLSDIQAVLKEMREGR